MELSREEVIRIAGLARIQLTNEEIGKFQFELSRILDYLDHMKELDTTGVIPTYQVTGLENRTREDEVVDEFKREDMLASAIEVAEGHIKVKGVFNKKT